MTATRNWDDLGIEWSEESVAKQSGPNATSRVAFAKMAQIPTVKDLGKLREHVSDEIILSWVNGTSARVQAQDVNRRELAKGTGVVEIRELVWARLTAVRVRGTGKAPVAPVHNYPDGTTYTGTDEVEYRSTLMAKYVDAGVEPALARTLAEGMAW